MAPTMRTGKIATCTIGCPYAGETGTDATTGRRFGSRVTPRHAGRARRRSGPGRRRSASARRPSRSPRLIRTWPRYASRGKPAQRCASASAAVGRALRAGRPSRGTRRRPRRRGRRSGRRPSRPGAWRFDSRSCASSTAHRGSTMPSWVSISPMRNSPRAPIARVGAEQQQRAGRDRVTGARHDHRDLRAVHARERARRRRSRACRPPPRSLRMTCRSKPPESMPGRAGDRAARRPRPRPRPRRATARRRARRARRARARWPCRSRS